MSPLEQAVKMIKIAGSKPFITIDKCFMVLCDVCALDATEKKVSDDKLVDIIEFLIDMVMLFWFLVMFIC